MIKIISLTFLLAMPARAQSGTAPRPCAIGEYRGTCFYVDGEVSYWIVRKWFGPEVGEGPTMIGYPSVLKVQQDYNRWIKTQKGSFISVDGPKAVPNLADAEKRHAKNMETIRKQTQEAMRGQYTPELWNEHLSIPRVIRHGWDRHLLTLPHEIPETGGLNPDTLRIPLYKIGARLLDAEESRGANCRYLHENVFWAGGKWLANGRWDDEFRKKGACNIETPPDDEKFAEMHSLLKIRGEVLATARESLLTFDKIFDSVEPLMGSSDGIAIERLPDGFLDQVFAMSAEIEEVLSQAADLDSEYQSLETAHRVRKQRESEERVRKLIQREKEADEKYAKEYFERFGVRLRP